MDLRVHGNPTECTVRIVIDWYCFFLLGIRYQVTNDGPVYSLCCLDGKVVSAGASNKISIWRPAMERSEVGSLAYILCILYTVRSCDITIEYLPLLFYYQLDLDIASMV